MARKTVHRTPLTPHAVPKEKAKRQSLDLSKGRRSGIPIKPSPVIDMSRMQQWLLPVYHQLKSARSTFVINYGGGGSGKSFAQAQYFVRRLLTKKHKLLVIRKYATSLNDSVIDQFRDYALPFFGLIENVHYTFNVSRRRFEFANGSVIIFRGLDDAEKFKSIAGITLVWIEEATEIEEAEFKIVNDRIRGKPQLFLTYNPISERHWLRKRFHHADDPHKGVDARSSDLHSFPTRRSSDLEKYIDDMEHYREHDPDHYRIYALGEFGIIRPENPYFTAWKPSLFVGKTTYNPIQPVCVSFDFNIKNSYVVSQHYDGRRIDFLEARHGEGDLKDMCRNLAIKYKHNRIMFTGDASGNAGSAYTTGNASAWTLIKGYMAEFGALYCEYEMVPKSNAGLATSRHMCNSLLVKYGKNIVVDRDECGILIDDIERMMATPEGSLDKLHANKNNYGHVGDCFRYCLNNFEYKTFKDMGLEKKQVV